MRYKNIFEYLQQVQKNIRENPNLSIDFDRDIIASLYEIAKSKNVFEAKRIEQEL